MSKGNLSRQQSSELGNHIEKKSHWKKFQGKEKKTPLDTKKDALKQKQSKIDREKHSNQDSSKQAREVELSQATAMQSYRHVSTYNGRFTEEQTMFLADFFLQVSTTPSPAQIDEIYCQVLYYLGRLLKFTFFLIGFT